MGDAKNRQRKKDGSHGKGRVDIEIAPVLAQAVVANKEDSVYFHPISYFLTTPISSTNNIAQKTYVLAAGSYVCKPQNKPPPY